MSGLDMGAGLQARGALEAQAHEQNRILSIGSPGSATIRGHVDTGEQVAGNPVWMFELEVTPEGGAPYTVQKREIISSVAMGGYADGTTMPCRIDPADPQHDRVRRQAVHVASDGYWVRVVLGVALIAGRRGRDRLRHLRAGGDRHVRLRGPVRSPRASARRAPAR